jgi:hypothetical protein
VTFGHSGRFGRLGRFRPGRRCVLLGSHSGKAAPGKRWQANQSENSPIEARGADYARRPLFDGAELIIFATLYARARGGADPARSDADRPAPAGSAALRLLADVDISFWRNCCSQIPVRCDDGGRAIGAIDDDDAAAALAMVPAPVEGREVPGHRQRSPNSAAPTVGALSLARSALRPLRIGKISGIWQN